MRVLAFRHVPFEGLGLIEPVLRARGIDVDYADLYLPHARVPDLAGYGGLILLGGPMSANDDLRFLRVEEECVRNWMKMDGPPRPILGICLGGQLITRALGAAVRRNPVKEIGWYDIQFAEAAVNDRLFRGLARETVFHWHGDTFDLPAGAELLARSELCGHQGYRMGERVYALQFHLEVTPEMIADWCDQDENCGDMSEIDTPLDSGFNAARVAELSTLVFGRWCGMLQEWEGSAGCPAILVE